MRLLIYQDYLRMGGTECHTAAIANDAVARGWPTLVLTNRPGGEVKARLKAPHKALQMIDTMIDEWAPGLERAAREFAPERILCMGLVANSMIPRLKKIWETSEKSSPKIIATVRSSQRITRGRRRLYRLAKADAAADLIIVNSFSLRNMLETLGLKTPVKVVGNGLLVAPTPDPVARMLLRRKFGADEKTTVILCLQRLLPRKGQHLLMEHFLCAAEREGARNAQLWLVGRGWFGWLLKAYAYALGDRGERIKIMPVEFPMSHYYNAADVAATVSHEDSLPNFLIEAHAFGLPGICEDYAGCAEVVVNGLTGVVLPVGGDLGYAGALQQLIMSPPLRAFFGTNAKILSFRFDFKRQMEKLFEAMRG